MQFCSKSELYQSIKTCNCISTEKAVAAVDGVGVGGGGGGGSGSSRSAVNAPQLFSASIDPPEVAGRYDFPCWSTNDADLRRALQQELPDEWQSLLKLGAFRNIEKQTFFDRPDTSKLSTLLAGRNGAMNNGKAGADGDEDAAEEPRKSFAELFRKRPVRAAVAATSNRARSAQHRGAGVQGGRTPTAGASKSRGRQATTRATGGAQNTKAKANATAGEAQQRQRSGLHQLLFGEEGEVEPNTPGDLKPIFIYLPNAQRTKITLHVSPRYTMSRTIKVLLAQEAVKEALGKIPGGHHLLQPSDYELKLHDEDGLPLDMAHNLADQTVAETGEEFVLQRRCVRE